MRAQSEWQSTSFTLSHSNEERANDAYVTQVVGPFDCTAMTADDLSLLYTLEKQQRLEPAIKALKQAFGKDDLTKVLEVNPAIVPGVISIVAASQLSNSPNAFGEPISNQRVDILSRLAIEHT